MQGCVSILVLLRSNNTVIHISLNMNLVTLMLKGDTNFMKIVCELRRTPGAKREKGTACLACTMRPDVWHVSPAGCQETSPIPHFIIWGCRLWWWSLLLALQRGKTIPRLSL